MIFHDMLAGEASGYFTVDTNFIRKATTGPTHLSFGAQFTHYVGPEGIEVSVVKEPMYDSRKYCKRMHPLYPAFPLDSARFTFLDFGGNMTMRSNNIQMLRVRDTYRWGYVAGTVSPTGPVKGGSVANKKAGYDMFTEGSAGVVIYDTSRGGEMYFDSDI